MTANTDQGNRSIPTGGLRIDGEPTSIELGWGHYRTSGADRNFICPLPLVISDKGIVLKEIKHALSTGHRVTAESGGDKSEFIKIGPLVLGFTERNGSLQSIGRFGLNTVLGAKG